MNDKFSSGPEIESFNLGDLDISALDARLELTTLLPQKFLPICPGNCSANGQGCITDGIR
jgi:hypothetical protein